MARVPESLIVEFCGAPGVGKSYINERLLAALQADGHDAHDGLRRVAATLPTRSRAVRKLAVAATEALRSPIGTARVARAVGRSGQSPRDLVMLVQNWLVVRGLMRSARRFGGIQLFDQGVVQQLCSVGFRGDWRCCLDAAAPGPRRLGPDVIVRVSAAIETNATRLRTRDSHHSRVEGLTEVDRLAELVRHDQELDEIEAAWIDRARSSIDVRRVAMTNDGELDAGQLAGLVARIL